jgi:hypothetical protein
MASISSKGAKGHHTYKLTLTEASTSTPNNTSSINYSFELIDDANWFWEQWGNSITYSISANGSVIKSGSIPNHTTKNQTIASGSFTVPHNADGTKTISYSFTVTDGAGQSYTSGNASASGTMALTKIPRYATVTQTFVSKTETSVNYTWTSDSTIDYIWVSINDGSTWKGYDITDAKSSTLSLSSLSANTTYKIKTRVRRKDSQLTTDSTALSVTTYNYPYCTKAPDFTIGNSVTLEFYNPLGRQIGWQMLGADGSLVAGNGTSGTSYSGINGDGSIANLYASIPNAKSGTYTVKVTYGSVVNTKTGGKYSIKGTEIPTINSFTYIDNNSTTVALTGNNQHIVQNYSSLVAQVGSATANKGAGGIAKYVVECNGKTVQNTSSGNFTVGAVNSNRNVDLKLTVTDTRGLSASKTITVTMLAHSTPTANVTLERLNNYEDETYLTVDGTVASVNSKNTMAIKYRYKQSGGSYGSYVNINDRQKYTLSLSKNNAYIFNIVITDALGSTFSKEYVLEKGMFPLFIDTVKNSVGINCFPENEYSLEVNGLDISTIKEFTKSLKLTANTWADTGIKYDDLPTGTYVMQVVLNNNTSAINNQFGERISGVLSWYALPTNGTDADVIPISKAGHSRNGHNIQLRILRTITSSGGVLKLQMMDDVSWNGNGDIVFKFKRLI